MNLNELSHLEPWLQAAIGLFVLMMVSFVLQWIARHVLARALSHVGSSVRPSLIAVLLNPEVLTRAAQIVPTLVVQLGIRFVPALPSAAVTVIGNVAAALTVFCIARTLFKMLDVLLDVHAKRSAEKGDGMKSIKSYVQLAQIFVALAALVVMIAALADKSPLIVLSGFGALSAVLMLIFQDTIKSFTAGVLIENNDMLRVGDWIEMPQAGADGDVIDMGLNTVKVQNWDKTIVTIPTWKLMSESFKNWRGMSESGGRRIKRTLMIDAGGIGFLSDSEVARLESIGLIKNYIHDKQAALQATKTHMESELGKDLASVPANQRRLTNIGTFRAYAKEYLTVHPKIHKEMTLMVRMLEPTAQGVPMEVYCFTNDIAWVNYEGIQGDIFDHLLAILPEFGLRAFQVPAGADMLGFVRGVKGMDK